MIAIEQLNKYALKCGLPESIKADDETYLLSGDKAMMMCALLDGNENESCVGFYLCNWPREIYADWTQDIDGGKVYGSENDAWIVLNDRIAMVVPISYCGRPVVKDGSIVAVSGDKEVGIVVVNDLTKSFTFYTR